MATPILEDDVSTWRKLNSFLRICTEEQVLLVMQYEVTHKKRYRMIVRAHCRLNYLRGIRERKELRKLYDHNRL